MLVLDLGLRHEHHESSSMCQPEGQIKILELSKEGVEGVLLEQVSGESAGPSVDEVDCLLRLHPGITIFEFQLNQTRGPFLLLGDVFAYGDVGRALQERPCQLIDPVGAGDTIGVEEEYDATPGFGHAPVTSDCGALARLTYDANSEAVGHFETVVDGSVVHNDDFDPFPIVLLLESCEAAGQRVR